MKKRSQPKPKWACVFFGHRPALYGTQPVYFDRVRHDGTDSVGRVHVAAYHACDRCGVQYLAGRLHLTDPALTRAVAETAAFARPDEVRA